MLLGLLLVANIHPLEHPLVLGHLPIHLCSHHVRLVEVLLLRHSIHLLVVHEIGLRLLQGHLIVLIEPRLVEAKVGLLVLHLVVVHLLLIHLHLVLLVGYKLLLLTEIHTVHIGLESYIILSLLIRRVIPWIDWLRLWWRLIIGLALFAQVR